MKKIYDFELEQAIEWTDKVNKKMKERGIDRNAENSFEQLEQMKWGVRYCQKCKDQIFTNGQSRICTVCQKRYESFTDEGLVYGN